MSINNKVNLLQMQEWFEGQVDRIRVISDLKLSENEYKSLGVRLKSLSFFAGSEKDIEDYMLSVLVYCTYSLLYGNIGTNFEEFFWQVVPENQYMKRMYLRWYKDVFYTYGISTYDVPRIDFLPRSIQLTARHAGIPDEDKALYYQILSNSSFSTEGHMYEELRDVLPPRSRYILDMMDDISREKLLKDSKLLVEDVLHADVSHNSALIDKYPELDLNLIVDCIMWGCDKNFVIKQAF